MASYSAMRSRLTGSRVKMLAQMAATSVPGAFATKMIYLIVVGIASPSYTEVTGCLATRLTLVSVPAEKRQVWYTAGRITVIRFRGSQESLDSHATKCHRHRHIRLAPQTAPPLRTPPTNPTARLWRERATASIPIMLGTATRPAKSTGRAHRPLAQSRMGYQPAARTPALVALG
jgi:hypothetical protein